jgi:acyl dehydratase
MPLAGEERGRILVKQDSTLEGLRKRIGTEAEPITFEIDRALIGSFVRAVGDSNPMWQDEEYARTTGYGSIIAPPFLLCALMTVCPHDSRYGIAPLPVPELPPPHEHILDGGEEWEFFRPMRLGDTISSRTRFADVFEREGRVGKMLFLVYETIYTNQHGESVAKASYTIVNY